MELPEIVPSALAAALESKGYVELTDVQNAVIAPNAQGADLLVSARTGSGKTVGFGLAMASELMAGEERLPAPGAPLALVIAPTRELALQVERELNWLYAKAGGKLATCVGGMDARSERRVLERGAHIVVGTPGRLRDHIERRALDLSVLKVAVLDEADEMLDFGFREDLEFILEAAPATRRTLMFSATVSKPIADLARRYQSDAERISTLGATGQHADITYLAHTVAGHERENAVINVLRYHDTPRALVFCATRDAVNRLAVRLQTSGFSAVSLSGELTQAERTKALSALRDGRARVCVATDVAARGIDLPGLDLVVHAEPPTNAESLQHRAGRSGRAGAKGVSVFVGADSRKSRVVRMLREARIEADWTDAPGAQEVREKDRERLIAHPGLSADPEGDRLSEARDLVERFGAERIAAAFLTEVEARLPAPYSLSDAPAPRGRETQGDRADRPVRANDDRPQRAPRRDRSEFDDETWFEVNLGRKHRAEPRWLLPLICRVGDVTGADIGAIRIEENATRFQIAEAKRQAFLSAIVRPRDHDANVRIARAGEEPLEPARTDAPETQTRPKRAPRAGKAERQTIKHKGFDPLADVIADRDTKRDAPRGSARDGARDTSRDSGRETGRDWPPKGKPARKPAGKFAGKPGGKPRSGYGSNASSAAGSAPGARAGGKPRRAAPATRANDGAPALKRVKRKRSD